MNYLKKTTVALTVVLIALIVGASVYGVYTLYSSPASPTPSPSPSSTPSLSPTPQQTETVTVVDETGVSVEVTLPVTRIVNIAPGAAEILCAIGGGEKIVGRDAYSTFPPSMSAVPIVAESSFGPNMEQILELNPDLIIADQGLSDANRQKFEAVGVPVIVEMLMEPRLEDAIRNFGTVLGELDKANDYINFTQSYETLVKDRIATLSQSEKPTVYFEWYQPWYTSSLGDSWDELIVSAGGQNIAPSTLNVSNPILSPEYVAEQSPEIIVRMLTRMDGEDNAAFETLRNEILSRTGLSTTTAVKESNVFIIHNNLLVLRPAIGLLYLAKWFHPTLFADIDPAAIHVQMIQKYFGITLSGVFAYP
ncbi:MAG: ABC transporter substrate-binding protein [Candidatus Bathyarchaeota archaeon]|nr:ABC transporter substrate-binding protein [Candidatus Bathyarchaeota archaeon]